MYKPIWWTFWHFFFIKDPAAGSAFDWTKAKLGVKYSYVLELRPKDGSPSGFFVSPDEIPASGHETLAGIVAMQLHH